MREKIFNTIGFALLALCFVASLTRIALMRFTKVDKNGAKGVTIRLAHWQLENGPREAFAKIAAEYMKLHPEVRVEQLVVPERIYPDWLVTQLIGGTAPDIIEIGKGTTDERIARFFAPITDLAELPDPYNKGTDLEGVPLRETFFDGMEGGYNQNLLEYYGVPISGMSIRIFFNLDLLKKITGSEELPRTYEALVALCQKAQKYAAENKLPLMPIAGSQYNAPMLMQSFFSSQTQKLSEKLNHVGILGTDPMNRASDFMQGRWSLDSPAVRSGFDLMHEIGQYMQPGFMQLQRDDATLVFVQGRAVMISTGSWDATSIRQQTAFRIGVAQIPFPSPENPVYGQFTLGNLSEAGNNAATDLGITRGSSHPEVARDFLLFLASRRINQLWTDASGWIPSIVGTKPSPDVAPFLPVTDGYLAGIPYTLGDSSSFTELNRLCSTSLHFLVGSFGSSQLYVDALRGSYKEALSNDLRRDIRTTGDIVQQGDTQLAALAWMARNPGSDAAATQRFNRFLQAASANQKKIYQMRLTLQKAGQPTE